MGGCGPLFTNTFASSLYWNSVLGLSKHGFLSGSAPSLTSCLTPGERLCVHFFPTCILLTSIAGAPGPVLCTSALLIAHPMGHKISFLKGKCLVSVSRQNHLPSYHHNFLERHIRLFRLSANSICGTVFRNQAVVPYGRVFFLLCYKEVHSQAILPLLRNRFYVCFCRVKHLDNKN